MDEFITRDDCLQRSSQFMEELKETKRDVKEVKSKLHQIDLRLAELPEVFADKFDSRYANKRVEEDLEKLEKKQETFENESAKKTYDWLKWLVGLVAGTIFGIVISAKF